MIYQKSLTIPAGTTKAEPVSDYMEVNKGFIYQVTAIIPTGCAGLAGIRILDGIYQAYPTTPNEWFIGDGSHHSFTDSYIKETPPYLFTLEGYNLDDTYDHTLTVMVGMEIKETFIARYLPSYNMQEIIKTLAAMKEAQDTQNSKVIQDAINSLKGN